MVYLILYSNRRYIAMYVEGIGGFMSRNNFLLYVFIATVLLQNVNGSEIQQDWKSRIVQPMSSKHAIGLGVGGVLLLFGLAKIENMIQIQAYEHFKEYRDLLDGEISSVQIQLLTDAKKSINMYKSPLEYKIVSDLIWLYGVIQDKCLAIIEENQTPVDQIKALVVYKNSFGEPYQNKRGYLSQKDWFARQFYNVIGGFNLRMIWTHYFADLDTVFIDGVIEEIIKKNHLKTGYTAKDARSYINYGVSLPKIDVPYIE